jgi:hypothetical protein
MPTTFFTLVLVVPFTPSPASVDRLALPVTQREERVCTGIELQN